MLGRETFFSWGVSKNPAIWSYPQVWKHILGYSHAIHCQRFSLCGFLQLDFCVIKVDLAAQKDWDWWDGRLAGVGWDHPKNDPYLWERRKGRKEWGGSLFLWGLHNFEERNCIFKGMWLILWDAKWGVRRYLFWAVLKSHNFPPPEKLRGPKSRSFLLPRSPPQKKDCRGGTRGDVYFNGVFPTF